MQDLIRFFHNISPQLIEYLAKNKTVKLTQQKGSIDYSTHIDESVEKIIIESINQYFPGDKILAEESNNNTEIGSEKIWIIDPICGTRNMARHINIFCTNIALAENGKVIASCVIDYSTNDYYWSIGDQKIYKNNAEIFNRQEMFGSPKIDFDSGCLTTSDQETIKKALNMLSKIRVENTIETFSLNSSLNLLYTALGRIDGTVIFKSNAWDMAASSFFIQQTGGVITEIDGSEWSLKSKTLIASRNTDLQAKLIDFYEQS